eukprot:TRINITY_DN4984_c0_g1_i1.p1 TRINITY_DN4984_c0_g1~~TRINITY_DN4984_c0_g1_i1.p1  ORF type:complete len:185 (+),score=20.73 TRINITY_DN4984_c0_g1_i1:46-555(+)
MALDKYPPFRWVINSRDNEHVRFQKKTLALFCLVGLVVSIGNKANNMNTETIGGLQGVFGIIGAVVLSAQFFYEKRMREPFIEFAIYCATIGTIITDYRQIVLGSRWWLGFLILTTPLADRLVPHDPMNVALVRPTLADHGVPCLRSSADDSSCSYVGWTQKRKVLTHS